MWWKLICPPLRECTETKADRRSSNDALPGPITGARPITGAFSHASRDETYHCGPIWLPGDGFKQSLRAAFGCLGPLMGCKGRTFGMLQILRCLVEEERQGRSLIWETWLGISMGKQGYIRGQYMWTGADHCGSVAVPCTWWVQSVQSSHKTPFLALLMGEGCACVYRPCV